MKTDFTVPERCLAVVIPAFRAEAHIADVLRGIPDYVAWIVVVDDCSPDHNTIAIVEETARRDPRIRLLRHEVNQGVGGAVLTGYREARRLGAEIIVKMDSDGQMDPRYLPALIDPIVRGRADYTKGNRYVHARQLRSMPLLRRIGNLGLSFLTKLASGYWSLFDPTNGYTAIHAAVIPMLNEEDIGRRYFFESSMLLELSLLRAVIRDVYIPAKYGDKTSHLAATVDSVLCAGFQHRVAISHGGAGAAADGRDFRRGPLVFFRSAWRGHAHGHGIVGRAAHRHGMAVSASSRGAGHSRSARRMRASRAYPGTSRSREGLPADAFLGRRGRRNAAVAPAGCIVRRAEKPMIPAHVVTLLCVLGLAIGQILFKVSATSLSETGSFYATKTVVAFSAAIVLYAITTIAWVWVLQRVDLGRVYPLMALARWPVMRSLANVFSRNTSLAWHSSWLELSWR